MRTAGARKKMAARELNRGARGGADAPLRSIARPTAKLTAPGLIAKDLDLLAIWNEQIVPLYWLTASDAMKALMWCVEWQKWTQMRGNYPTARLRELRMLGGELGLDPSSRERISVSDEQAPTKGIDKFA